MILSDDEIKDGLNYHGHWLVPSKEMLAESHLEASSRIRELEAQVQEWHERYVICCEDSRLEREALRNELIEANARVRELEANIDRWFRDHQKLSEAFIRQCDRADFEAKLRELAEAAEWRDECRETAPFRPTLAGSDNSRIRCCNLDYFGNEELAKTKQAAEAAYQAALKAAKEG